jgi:hypothetical protein
MDIYLIVGAVVIGVLGGLMYAVAWTSPDRVKRREGKRVKKQIVEDVKRTSSGYRTSLYYDRQMEPIVVPYGQGLNPPPFMCYHGHYIKGEVFERAELFKACGCPFDPDILGKCFYKPEHTDEVGEVMVCMLHRQNSKYNIKEGSRLPCVALDPYEE